MSAYQEDRQHWIVFDRVSNFRVGGGGTFNGKGKKWWQSSCKVNTNLVSHWILTFIYIAFRYCNYNLWILTFITFLSLRWFTCSHATTDQDQKSDNILYTIKFYMEMLGVLFCFPNCLLLFLGIFCYIGRDFLSMQQFESDKPEV